MRDMGEGEKKPTLSWAVHIILKPYFFIALISSSCWLNVEVPYANKIAFKM